MPSILTLTNPKAAKSAAFGFLTAVVHLAPAAVAAIRDARGRLINVCGHATAGCLYACLFTAGRAGILRAGEVTNNIIRARIARTALLFADEAQFAERMIRETVRAAAVARSHGLRLALRPNGTSDCDWTQFPSMLFALQGLEALHGVRLYDYTKDPSRADAYAKANLPLDLTYSLAETAANRRAAAQWLADGGRVAAVFDTAKGRPFPETLAIGDSEPFHVIDGDEHDARFLEPGRVVVGLRAKGRAKRDRTGFVLCARGTDRVVL